MYRNMMYNVPQGGAFSAITAALTFSSCGSHPHAALTRCVQLPPQKGLNHDLRVLQRRCMYFRLVPPYCGTARRTPVWE